MTKNTTLNTKGVAAFVLNNACKYIEIILHITMKLIKVAHNTIKIVSLISNK